MKTLTLCLFCWFLTIKTGAQTAQQPTINSNKLVGTWQIQTAKIGNGLNENFRFFKDKHFVYTFDPSDETRRFLKLTGTYRLVNKSLYLMIKSRDENLGGELMAGAIGTDKSLFTLNNAEEKVVLEKDPKELDPLFVSRVVENHRSVSLYINNRQFFKVSSNPLAFNE